MARRMLPSAELLRFGIVSVLGVVIDLGTAWALAHLLGVPLALAAMLSFCVAALFNYVLHETWTFANGDGLSARRGWLYILTLGLTLGSRLAIVALLQRVFMLGKGQELYALLPAVGCSFFINYLVSKLLVFRASHGKSGG